MRLHERHDLTTKAAIAIQLAVVEKAKGLTFAELTMIMAGVIQSWAKFEIRDERREEPDEQAMGEVKA